MSLDPISEKGMGFFVERKGNPRRTPHKIACGEGDVHEDGITGYGESCQSRNENKKGLKGWNLELAERHRLDGEIGVCGVRIFQQRKWKYAGDGYGRRRSKLNIQSIVDIIYG